MTPMEGLLPCHQRSRPADCTVTRIITAAGSKASASHLPSAALSNEAGVWTLPEKIDFDFLLFLWGLAVVTGSRNLIKTALEPLGP